MLSDSYFNRLRSPLALRFVVGAYLLGIAVMATLWTRSPVLGLAGIALWSVLFLTLRLAVRSQADLPDEMLDERMVAERDRSYLHAYRLFAGLMTLGAMAALFAVVAVGDDETISFDYNTTNAIFWLVLAVAMGAPSISLALLQSQRGVRPYEGG
jgi:hypothetical protein